MFGCLVSQRGSCCKHCCYCQHFCSCVRCCYAHGLQPGQYENGGLGAAQVLQEEYQILPNGVQRARGVPLSEKMKAGEAWQDAVLRAVKEELGSVLPSEPEVGRLVEQHLPVDAESCACMENVSCGCSVLQTLDR